jgi:hypothetical protein
LLLLDEHVKVGLCDSELVLQLVVQLGLLLDDLSALLLGGQVLLRLLGGLRELGVQLVLGVFGLLQLSLVCSLQLLQLDDLLILGLNLLPQFLHILGIVSGCR